MTAVSSSRRVPGSRQEELESRYEHLLKPIRDLTKNWQIDIASELEDYLEELERISVSFDGGATNVDFAEGKHHPRLLSPSFG